MKAAKDFFTPGEKARIEAAVHAAEERSSGEIVPVLVDAAYDYPRAEIIGGGCFAIGLALLGAWLWGDSSEWIFLPLFLLLYFPCKWLIRFTPPLKRLLIPPEEMRAEVEEKALVSFVEHGIYRTREGTGVLILISLFEHRVHILADAGINERVSPTVWQEMVDTITTGLRQQQACDALCAAIARGGELLAEHFPRRADDRNELPNLVIEGH